MAIYHEGDGIEIYFVLADEQGRPTAANGIFWLRLTLKDAWESQIIWLQSKVKISDFKRTHIGIGPYERESTILSIGRFSYDELNHIRKRNSDKLQDEMGEEREDPHLFTKSLKGSNGKAKLQFAWGKLYDKVETDLKEFANDGSVYGQNLHVLLENAEMLEEAIKVNKPIKKYFIPTEEEFTF